MIFVKDQKQYMKVWDIKPSEKYTDLRVTTSEKKDDGTYENSSWFVRCIGHAHNKIKEVKVRDTIIANRFRLTNTQGTAKDGSKRSYFRFILLDFELSQGNGRPLNDAPAPEAPQQTAAEEASEDDMPF